MSESTNAERLALYTRVRLPFPLPPLWSGADDEELATRPCVVESMQALLAQMTTPPATLRQEARDG